MPWPPLPESSVWNSKEQSELQSFWGEPRPGRAGVGSLGQRRLGRAAYSPDLAKAYYLS